MGKSSSQDHASCYQKGGHKRWESKMKREDWGSVWWWWPFTRKCDCRHCWGGPTLGLWLPNLSEEKTQQSMWSKRRMNESDSTTGVLEHQWTTQTNPDPRVWIGRFRKLVRGPAVELDHPREPPDKFDNDTSWWLMHWCWCCVSLLTIDLLCD